MASGLWSHPLPLPQGRLPHAAPYSGLREYPGHTWALDSETVPIYDTLNHPNCDVLWACFCRNLLGLTQCLLLCGAVSQKYLLGRHYFHRGTMDRTCGTSIKVQFYLSIWQRFSHNNSEVLFSHQLSTAAQQSPSTQGPGAVKVEIEISSMKTQKALFSLS